mmetsp:Transcript_4396/g.6383  ORF Transcript_4396/g.6383 Transcript_4396/m.6383 type:complete len:96 (+) Transcript_4396:1167-1454(+)
MLMMKETPRPLKNFKFSFLYHKETICIQHKLFDYDQSNGVFMKMYPYEEYPLSLGSVIQMGTKTQFLVERYNVGFVAAPGRRAVMEDSYIIIQDL